MLAPRPGAPGLLREGSRHPRPPAQVEIVQPPIRRPQRRWAADEPARRARRGRRRAAARPPRPPVRRERRRPGPGARPERPAPGGRPPARRSRGPSAARVPTGTTRRGQRLCERPRRRQADPQAGERAGPDPHRDRVDRPPSAGPLRRSLDLGQQLAAWRGRAPSRAAQAARSLSASPSRVTATTRSSVAVSQPTIVVTPSPSGPSPRSHGGHRPACVSSTRSAAGSLERIGRGRPFDERDRVRGQVVVQEPRVLGAQVTEAEQVEVGDRHAPAVPVPDREGGRGHGSSRRARGTRRGSASSCRRRAPR